MSHPSSRPNWKRRARKARLPKPKPQGYTEYLNDDPETHTVVIRTKEGRPLAYLNDRDYFDIVKSLASRAP